MALRLRFIVESRVSHDEIGPGACGLEAFRAASADPVAVSRVSKERYTNCQISGCSKGIESAIVLDIVIVASSESKHEQCGEAAALPKPLFNSWLHR